MYLNLVINSFLILYHHDTKIPGQFNSVKISQTCFTKPIRGRFPCMQTNLFMDKVFNVLISSYSCISSKVDCYKSTDHVWTQYQGGKRSDSKMKLTASTMDLREGLG